MKVADLVMVGSLPWTIPPRNGHKPFVSIITAICLPADQVNGMHLIQVLESGMYKWYPVGYIKVISETW